MKFLVLLITLGGYKFFGWRTPKSCDTWFEDWAGRVDEVIPSRSIALIITLLLPVLGAALILNLVGGWLLGLVGILLQALLLFYSLGRGNLVQATESYLQELREGDSQAAYIKASEHFHTDQAIEAQDFSEMHRQVRVGLFYQWFEQVFLVVFWYLLAGPLAALFIRLLCLYGGQCQEVKSGSEGNDEGDSEADTGSSAKQRLVTEILHWLEWLPSRLVGLTFAIAGNFTVCFKTWADVIFSARASTVTVLHRSGLAALGVCTIENSEAIETTPDANDMEACAGEIQTIQDLISRSLICWVIVVALLTILV